MGLKLNFNDDYRLPQTGEYAEIFRALNAHLLKKGKKVRPKLCYLSAELFGVDKKQVKNIARASEYIHAAFLAHDDVIDNANTRRGLKSLNSATSNKKAVLAGDSLLAEATNLIVEYDNLAIYKDLSWVIQEAVSGEWLQLDNIGNVDVAIETIEDIGFKKTGALISWCMSAPAHLNKESAEVIDLCKRYAKHVGIAFQLKDDILDFDPHSGKKLYKDIEEGIINSVSHFLLKEEPKLRYLFEDKIKLTPHSEPWKSSSLQSSMANVEQRAQSNIDQAIECLNKIHCLKQNTSRRSSKALSEFIKYSKMVLRRKK